MQAELHGRGWGWLHKEWPATGADTLALRVQMAAAAETCMNESVAASADRQARACYHLSLEVEHSQSWLGTWVPQRCGGGVHLSRVVCTADTAG